MNSRLPRKLILFVVVIFAIVGAISIFKNSQSPESVNWGLPTEQDTAKDDKLGVEDIPFRPLPTERVELRGLGLWNTVMCWPSIGGIILNDRITSVELDFLSLPRLDRSPRSFNASEEDAFCHLLRKTGGKWWPGYYHYDEMLSQLDYPIAKQKEAIILGWPEEGGVWVLHAPGWGFFGGQDDGFWRFVNAHTMRERCEVLKMNGAVFYENPGDHDAVAELLGGFGEFGEVEKNDYM